MGIAIDTSVTFDLAGDRHVTVDAYELDQFKDQLFADKGVDPPKGPDGQPLPDEQGKPQRRTLPWPIVHAAVIAFIKEKTQIDIKVGEAIAIWKMAGRVWAEKNASWDEPEVAEPGSQPSPNSMGQDPRSSED